MGWLTQAPSIVRPGLALGDVPAWDTVTAKYLVGLLRLLATGTDVTASNPLGGDFRIAGPGAFGLPVLAADPANPVNGDLWYNTTLNQFRLRQNGVTVGVGSPLTPSLILDSTIVAPLSGFGTFVPFLDRGGADITLKANSTYRISTAIQFTILGASQFGVGMTMRFDGADTTPASEITQLRVVDNTYIINSSTGVFLNPDNKFSGVSYYPVPTAFGAGDLFTAQRDVRIANGVNVTLYMLLNFDFIVTFNVDKVLEGINLTSLSGLGNTNARILSGIVTVNEIQAVN